MHVVGEDEYRVLDELDELLDAYTAAADVYPPGDCEDERKRLMMRLRHKAAELTRIRERASGSD